MRLSAVLVNYNAGHELARALQSIADELVGQAWEAIVVDNASSDGSRRIVDDFAPQVRLVCNERNVGFARAANQGVEEAVAPFVLIMNPDCRLVAGAINTLQFALEQDQTCAMVGPRVVNPDGSEQGSARGDPNMLTGLFGRTGLFRRVLPFLDVSRRNVVASTDDKVTGQVVDWVAGACVLARVKALEVVGGFDEGYFLYWEDADLCRRLRAAGYTIHYLHSATAVHRVGVSSQTAKAVAIRAFHQSAYRYYTTHVAPGIFDPRRWFARAMLGARCRWKLRGARQQIPDI
jgi:hypothetical protein